MGYRNEYDDRRVRIVYDGGSGVRRRQNGVEKEQEDQGVRDKGRIWDVVQFFFLGGGIGVGVEGSGDNTLEPDRSQSEVVGWVWGGGGGEVVLFGFPRGVNQWDKRNNLHVAWWVGRQIGSLFPLSFSFLPQPFISSPSFLSSFSIPLFSFSSFVLSLSYFRLSTLLTPRFPSLLYYYFFLFCLLFLHSSFNF